MPLRSDWLCQRGARPSLAAEVQRMGSPAWGLITCLRNFLMGRARNEDQQEVSRIYGDGALRMRCEIYLPEALRVTSLNSELTNQLT